MNNVKFTAKVSFDPGAVKANPVHTTAKVNLRVYSNGVPPVTVKTPLVTCTKPNAVVFNPGAAKAAPVRTTAKTKVATVRARATATVRQRSYVTQTRARTHVSLVVPPGTAAGKPHDRKIVYSRITHNPPALPPGSRNYVTKKRASTHVVLLRPAPSHDRKIATAKISFTSFGSGRASKFAWR